MIIITTMIFVLERWRKRQN